MITKNFIKMCEKNKKLQMDWQPIEGDRFVYKNDITAGVVIWFEEGQYLHLEDKIFLPTQEQLQEMLKDVSFHIWGSFDNLYMTAAVDYHRRNAYQVGNNIKSMNELWLAFVMKEKYSKIWTGEKWVKAQ